DARESKRETDRLHPALRKLVERVKKHGGVQAYRDGDVVVTDGKVQVSIVLRELTDAVLEQLKKAGVEILNRTKTARIVVARVPVERLDDDAKLAAVLRIDPVK
ncbi:MAG: hypothetical protein V3T70_03055, partial [Phycisphaerae bacterium]